jgi:hypothetical protein
LFYRAGLGYGKFSSGYKRNSNTHKHHHHDSRVGSAAGSCSSPHAVTRFYRSRVERAHTGSYLAKIEQSYKVVSSVKAEKFNKLSKYMYFHLEDHRGRYRSCRTQCSFTGIEVIYRDSFPESMKALRSLEQALGSMLIRMWFCLLLFLRRKNCSSKTT